jgi:hypothetical protein
VRLTNIVEASQETLLDDIFIYIGRNCEYQHSGIDSYALRLDLINIKPFFLLFIWKHELVSVNVEETLNAKATLVRAQHLAGLEAIHDGHVQIQENQVVGTMIPRFLYCCQTTKGLEVY